MTPEAIKKLGPYSTLFLPCEANADGSPVKVVVYVDPETHRAYQLDERNRRLPEADSSTASAYGPWRRY